MLNNNKDKVKLIYNISQLRSSEPVQRLLRTLRQGWATQPHDSDYLLSKAWRVA